METSSQEQKNRNTQSNHLAKIWFTLSPMGDSKSQEHTVSISHQIVDELHGTNYHYLPFRTWNFVFLKREVTYRNRYQKLETVEEWSICLPVECIMDRFTIEVDDNIAHWSGTKKFNISSQ